MLALVPGFALAFSLANTVRLKEYLIGLLYERLEDHKVFLDTLLSFSENILNKTSDSILFVFGFILMIWAMIRMFSHLENALNTVWQIQRKRSPLKKLRDYFAVMLIGPLFFLAASSVTFFLISRIKTFIETLPIASALDPFIIFLLKMTPYGMIWLLFILLYFLMPSKRVPFYPTLIGALIAGTIYQIMQWGYITFQVGVTQTSAIYGSFAFLPLFMIWMQLSWIVFLLGGEIGYSISHVRTYELEKRKESLSIYKKKLISLWMVIRSIEAFQASKFLEKEKVCQTFFLASDLVSHLFQELVDLKLLIKVSEKNKEGFIPAMPYEGLTIADVMMAIEKNKESFSSKEELFVTLEKTLENMNHELKKTPKNALLINVLKKIK